MPNAQTRPLKKRRKNKNWKGRPCTAHLTQLLQRLALRLWPRPVGDSRFGRGSATTVYQNGLGRASIVQPLHDVQWSSLWRLYWKRGSNLQYASSV